MSRIRIRRAALLAAVLLVPACGGGGGGGGGSGTAPAAPTGLAATWGDAQVVLSWIASSGATSYNVYRSTTSGGSYTSVGTPSTTTHTDTPLANGTTYYYVVGAVNSAGESGPSAEVSGAPNTVPAAPGAPGAVPGDGQVALSWGAVGGVTGYRVERGLTPGGPYAVVASPAGTSYTDTGLTNGTPYYYVVRGVNGSVVGPASPEASATPIAVTTFNQAAGLDYTVWAVAPAADGTGDLYAAGEFRSFGTQAIRAVMRLNSDGTFDSGFSPGTSTGPMFARALAPVSTGQVYVGGSFSFFNGTTAERIVRLNANGSVDGTFATGTGFFGDVYALATATDTTGAAVGDVYVGGAFTQYNGTLNVNRIVRLNSNGTIDSAFNVGTAFSNTGSGVHVIVPATDGSGDIYVGGQFTTFNGIAVGNIVRLNNDGTRDAAFAATSGGVVFAIALAADGSGDVFVGGAFSTFNGASQDRIVRVKSTDGATVGTFVTGSSFTNNVQGLVAAGTDVYACGLFTSYGGTSANRIVRLNGDGSIDGTFAYGTGLNGEAKALAPDGAGGIFVGGFFTAYNGVGVDRLARINSSGTLVTLPIGAGFSNVVYAMAFVPSSTDVYVGGIFTQYNGAAHAGLVRLNSDGTVDSTLNTGQGFVGAVTCLAVAPDGDLYVAGTINWYNGTFLNGIVRLNPNGSIDTAFNPGAGFNGTVWALAVAPDGSGDLYAGGAFTGYDGQTRNRIVRLNSDGSRDDAFDVGTGFSVPPPPPPLTCLVHAIAPATDGSRDIYVGGQFTSYKGSPVSRNVVRLNEDGSPDSGFNAGTGFTDIVNAIAPDTSGNVYFAGWFGQYNGSTANRIARVSTTGTFDATFGTNVGIGFNGFTQCLALMPGGDVYVGGSFQFFNGGIVRPLVRLNSDGTLDSGFPATITAAVPGEVKVLATVPDASGRLYMGGNIWTWAGTTMDFFARLTSVGAVE